MRSASLSFTLDTISHCSCPRSVLETGRTNPLGNCRCRAHRSNSSPPQEDQEAKEVLADSGASGVLGETEGQVVRWGRWSR